MFTGEHKCVNMGQKMWPHDMMIYLLTAMGLTRGGSSTVNNTQNNAMRQHTQNRTQITIRIYNIIIIHNLQNSTEAYKTYKHMYNGKNRTRRKWRKNAIHETAI